MVGNLRESKFNDEKKNSERTTKKNARMQKGHRKKSDKRLRV